MRSNALYVFLGQAVVSLTPLLLTPYVTRVIGPSGIGLYSLSFSVVSVFMVVGQLGVQLYGRREIAKCGEDRRLRTRTFWEIYGLLIRSNIIVGAAYGLMLLIVPFGEDVLRALILQFLFLLSGALNIGWLFNGVEKFKLVSFALVGSRVALFVGVLTFVQKNDDALIYVGWMAFGFALASAAPWIAVGGIIGRPERSALCSNRHLVPLFNFLVSSLALQLLSVTSIYVLGALASIEDVGVFDLGFRLARAPIAFIEVVAVILLPRATRFVVQNDISSRMRFLRKGMAWTMFLASGCGVVLIGTARTLIPLYAGPEFGGSVNVLRVVGCSLVVIGWGNLIRNQVLLPFGRDSVYSVSLILGLVVLGFTSVIMINKYGVVGAAFAFLISEFVVVVYQTVHSREYFRLCDLFFVALRYVGPGVIAVLGMLLLGLAALPPPTTLVLQLVVGGSVFVGGVAAAEVMTDERVILGEMRRIFKGRGV